MKKIFFGLAVCLFVLAAAHAWAQTNYVLDTGDPNERVCNPKSYTDLGNGIVRDNVTGLEWVQDGNLIASRNSSFDNDFTAGDGAVTWQHARDYIDLLNAGEYLGHDDWRLPTIEELSTLVDAGRYNPAIDPVFSVVASSYWSSTIDAKSADWAWLMYFATGYLNEDDTSYGNYVRAVRGGPYGSSDNFVSNGDGTVTDQNTGLMWQLCNYGQTWNGGQCTGSAGTRTWIQAADYIQGLNGSIYLGYRDWRLPARNELQSLLDYNRQEPATIFPNTVASDYWSSTTSNRYTDDAWDVDFAYGYVYDWVKSYGNYVRAVRGGPCRADGDWCIDESDCPDGSDCVEGACVEDQDQPPVFLSEPLWVGAWVGLSSDPANPNKPQSKDILFWAYNDDKLACPGGVELSWMYRPVELQAGEVVALGDGDWVLKEPWRFLWFVWIETPGIADIVGSGLFEFKMVATDCMGQMTDSEGFWGKRYYFQVD